MSRNYFHLGLWVAIYEAMGFLIGSLTASQTAAWYPALEKSVLTPPNFVFPVMWSLLYVFIAFAGWAVWGHRQERQGRIALAIFAVYTVLNWSWSFVFFSFHQLALGYVWIMLINGVNLVFLVYTWNKFRSAALAMIPPLLWTCFAAYLNYMVWILNS